MILPDDKSVIFGGELVLANDIFVAKEYPPDGGSQVTALAQQYGKQVEALQLKISQRDELLRDLSEKLRCKNAENVSLRNNLHEAQDIIATVELSRDEMVEDLTQVSVDTRLLEANLQRAIAEKTALEAELASRLTEIVELHLLNSEFESQLLLRSQEHDHNTTLIDEAGILRMTGSAMESFAQESGIQAGVLQSVILSSGREVNICHQFSGHPRHDIAGRMVTTLRQSCYITLIIVSLLIMIVAASIFSTAAINRTTAGEALDVLIDRLTT